MTARLATFGARPISWRRFARAHGHGERDARRDDARPASGVRSAAAEQPSATSPCAAAARRPERASSAAEEQQPAVRVRRLDRVLGCRCAARSRRAASSGPTMSGTLPGKRTIALNPSQRDGERRERGRAERRHDRLIRAAGARSPVTSAAAAGRREHDQTASHVPCPGRPCGERRADALERQHDEPAAPATSPAATPLTSARAPRRVLRAVTARTAATTSVSTSGERRAPAERVGPQEPGIRPRRRRGRSGTRPAGRAAGAHGARRPAGPTGPK